MTLTHCVGQIMPAGIDYQQEMELSADEFIDLLVRSTLAERRPIDQPDVMQQMLDRADLLITARHDGLLIGIARALSDFAYCTYLADLAVDAAWQKQGIGRELLQRTHAAAGLQTTLILLATPKAVEYYPHIGLTRHESCWIQAAQMEPPSTLS